MAAAQLPPLDSSGPSKWKSQQKIMKMYYYAGDGDKPIGPFTLPQLRELATKGAIGDATHIILEGANAWQTWSEVKATEEKPAAWQPPPVSSQTAPKSEGAATSRSVRPYVLCGLVVAAVIAGWMIRNNIRATSEEVTPAQRAHDEAYESANRILGGKSLPASSSAAGETSQRPGSVSVVDVVRAKLKNAAAFERDFKGKRVTIAGHVHEIKPDAVAMMYTTGLLENPNGPNFISVLFNFPPRRRDSLPSLSKGQLVNIAGEFRGNQGPAGIIFEDCSLVR